MPGQKRGGMLTARQAAEQMRIYNEWLRSNPVIGTPPPAPRPAPAPPATAPVQTMNPLRTSNAPDASAIIPLAGIANATCSALGSCFGMGKKSGYRLRKAPKRELYWVIAEDGTKKSKEPIPLARAKAQMRALYASMKGGNLSETWSLLQKHLDDVQKEPEFTKLKTIPQKKKFLQQQVKSVIEEMTPLIDQPNEKKNLITRSDTYIRKVLVPYGSDPDQEEAVRRRLAELAKNPIGTIIGNPNPIGSDPVFRRLHKDEHPSQGSIYGHNPTDFRNYYTEEDEKLNTGPYPTEVDIPMLPTSREQMLQQLFSINRRTGQYYDELMRAGMTGAITPEQAAKMNKKGGKLCGGSRQQINFLISRVQQMERKIAAKKRKGEDTTDLEDQRLNALYRIQELENAIVYDDPQQEAQQDEDSEDPSGAGLRGGGFWKLLAAELQDRRIFPKHGRDVQEEIEDLTRRGFKKEAGFARKKKLILKMIDVMNPDGPLDENGKIILERIKQLKNADDLENLWRELDEQTKVKNTPAKIPLIKRLPPSGQGKPKKSKKCKKCGLLRGGGNWKDLVNIMSDRNIIPYEAVLPLLAELSQLSSSGQKGAQGFASKKRVIEEAIGQINPLRANEPRNAFIERIRGLRNVTELNNLMLELGRGTLPARRAPVDPIIAGDVLNMFF